MRLRIYLKYDGSKEINLKDLIKKLDLHSRCKVQGFQDFHKRELCSLVAIVQLQRQRQRMLCLLRLRVTIYLDLKYRMLKVNMIMTYISLE